MVRTTRPSSRNAWYSRLRRLYDPSRRRSCAEFVREGVKGLLYSPKKAAAELVGIPYGRHPETCPVRALLTWLELLPADNGPVFRSFDRWGHIRPSRLKDEWVADVVKRCVSQLA